MPRKRKADRVNTTGGPLAVEPLPDPLPLPWELGEAMCSKVLLAGPRPDASGPPRPGIRFQLLGSEGAAHFDATVRLMVAARELLAACENVLRRRFYQGAITLWPDDIEQIRVAVARAKGGA